jgi:hypothetical protein
LVVLRDIWSGGPIPIDVVKASGDVGATNSAEPEPPGLGRWARE